MKKPVPTRATLYLAVGLGSAIGGVARWWLSDALQSPAGHTFPWGTLWVNLSGSFLIGVYAALVAPGGRWSQGVAERLFFMTGFCGGYTTFSVFSLEAVLLLQSGHAGLAGTYVGVSLALWLAAVWTGYTLGVHGRWGAAR
jgi:fluoride exporter